jgi:6-pyruvoyltetrahydropterin/6-carboxytetrahydropterin synthase
MRTYGPITMVEANLTVRVHFSALHSLENKALSEKENIEIFGKCYRTHGHDYHLEVTVQGTIDPRSGLIVDREKLYAALDENIIKKYHGSHLNEFFKNTSGEALVAQFETILKDKLLPAKLHSLRLQETAKNFFSTDFRS